MIITLSVTGEKQIDEVLRGLKYEFSHKVFQAAHAEAAKPLVHREHRLAPVGLTGKLADSIGVIKLPFSRAGSLGEVQVGPRRGRFGGSHAHFIEDGTLPRKFKGANRGAVKKKPFIQPAFDQTKEQVLSGISYALAVKTGAFLRRKIKNING